MAVERLGNGLFKVCARHAFFCQPLEQYLALVEKARGAIAALKREVLDEGFLQDGKFAVLGVAFHRADRFAVKAHRRDDAGRAGVTRAVRIIDDHRAAQALRRAAAEFGAGEPKIFAQIIVHGEFVANFRRAVYATIDRYAQRRHASTPLIISWLTGTARKRWPVASKIALISAAMTGIPVTSAMPFGRSLASTAGSTSISRSRSGRSDPRATTYCPRFHLPLPGPSSKAVASRATYSQPP